MQIMNTEDRGEYVRRISVLWDVKLTTTPVCLTARKGAERWAKKPDSIMV
jgi:hypothetical protein